MAYFLLYGVFAIWVLFDCMSRKVGIASVAWAFGTAMLGPIVLPVYLANRPLKDGELREGGRAWNILKNFAILWTVVIAIVVIVALGKMGDFASKTTPGDSVGVGIGIVAGMVMLAAVWFFPTLGAALIGFFLKKNAIVETGPTGALVGVGSRGSAI